MEGLKELLKKEMKEEGFIYGVLSGIRKRSEATYNKVTIKPVLIKDEILFQFTYYYDKKVKHQNLEMNEAEKSISDLLKCYFKQGMVYTISADYQILVSKKGKMKILKKAPTKKQVDLSHNRKKKYIIEEDKPCSFLIRLGVMNKEGKVFTNKYDKFKQINRFLEMVDDCVPYLDKNRTNNIIDFGCGKSYLTFALYYYLVEKLGLSINIIGLDLKEDVIKLCNNIAKDLEYDKLKFIHGNIKEFEETNNVDMVVSLHACDTATDEALSKAVKWNAKVILSVPCCQHELLNKIKNDAMIPMTKHGIIKEKLSSLVTDSIRGNVLEIMGYSVQLLEFIDMEHTPKNILIRAFKNNKNDKDAINEYLQFKEFWKVEPYIEKSIGEKLQKRLRKNES